MNFENFRVEASALDVVLCGRFPARTPVRFGGAVVSCVPRPLVHARCRGIVLGRRARRFAVLWPAESH